MMSSTSQFVMDSLEMVPVGGVTVPRVVLPLPSTPPTAADGLFDFDFEQLVRSHSASPLSSSHSHHSHHSSPYFDPMPVTWVEHTYAPPPPPPFASARPAQTHGNRDFISANFEHGAQALGKPSGACTRCKRLKMKCELRSGEAKCQRCKGGDYECIPARRRPRRPRAPGPLPPGQAKRAQKQRAQLSPPGDATEDDDDASETDSDAPRLPARTCPMGVIERMASIAPNGASASAAAAAARGGDDGASDVTAIGDDALPAPDHVKSPYVPLATAWDDATSLVPALISAHEERELFDLFMTFINPCAALLDPQLHTFDYVKLKSQFLMTVMTAVASRHCGRPLDKLYMPAMERARLAAALTLVNSGKSVETCQAYILLALYGKPVRRGEEDRGWQHSGLAIRMATDLNLHRMAAMPPRAAADERSTREAMNRARVWLVCFNLDRSFSTQFGRPPTILNAFPNPRLWWHCAGENGRWNDPYDTGSCAFAEVMVLMTTFQERIFCDASAASGIDRSVNLEMVTREFDAQLVASATYWQPLLDGRKLNDAACRYRARLFPFCTAYSRLVMWSFGFQEAFARGAIDRPENVWFTQCHDAASAVIDTMVNDLSVEVFYKYAFQSHYVYVTFAAAFLLKLLRSSFDRVLAHVPGARERIIDRVQRVVEVFSSSAVAADDGHAPRHYARFLRSVLAKQASRTPRTSPGRAPPPPAQMATPLGMGTVVYPESVSVSPPMWPTHAHVAAPPIPLLNQSNAWLAQQQQSFIEHAQQQLPPPPPPGQWIQPQQQPQQPQVDANAFPLVTELMNEDWWSQFHMPGFWGTLQAPQAPPPAPPTTTTSVYDFGVSVPDSPAIF